VKNTVNLCYFVAHLLRSSRVSLDNDWVDNAAPIVKHLLTRAGIASIKQAGTCLDVTNSAGEYLIVRRWQ